MILVNQNRSFSQVFVYVLRTFGKVWCKLVDENVWLTLLRPGGGKGGGRDSSCTDFRGFFFYYFFIKQAKATKLSDFPKIYLETI